MHGVGRVPGYLKLAVFALCVKSALFAREKRVDGRVPFSGSRILGWNIFFRPCFFDLRPHPDPRFSGLGTRACSFTPF